MKWIDKNIELPTKKTIVDIIMLNGKRETDVMFDPRNDGLEQFYKHKDKRFPEMRTVFLLTHWMPLPKPPNK